MSLYYTTSYREGGFSDHQNMVFLTFMICFLVLVVLIIIINCHCYRVFLSLLSVLFTIQGCSVCFHLCYFSLAISLNPLLIHIPNIKKKNMLFSFSFLYIFVLFLFYLALPDTPEKDWWCFFFFLDNFLVILLYWWTGKYQLTSHAYTVQPPSKVQIQL